MRHGQPGHLLGERPSWTPSSVTDEPPHRQPDHYRRTAKRGIPQYPPVAAMHPRRGYTTASTLGRGGSRRGLDHEPTHDPFYLLNDHITQV